MFALVISSFVVVVAATVFWGISPGRPEARLAWFPNAKGPVSTKTGVSPVFLFENSRLTQSNTAALRLFGCTQTSNLSWPDVRNVLAEFVPQIPLSLKTLKDGVRVYPEQIETHSHVLQIDHRAPFTRVTLQKKDAAEPQAPGPASMEAPFPIWALGNDGKLLWKNRAFIRAGFDSHLANDLHQQSGPTNGRFSLHGREGRAPRHYRLFKNSANGNAVYYAHSAEETVAAETSRQDVVQTLGKTFAQLSTGLVVFDSSRNLVLFNPAVIDLFGFSAGFLSARPCMENFFDHMRDNCMIPEPKNYFDWRAQLSSRASDPTEPRFRENWQLPNGTSVRVTGLPNPDGGVGFLFEDISSQVSTTRRFRDELAMTQTLLDSLDDAIAAVDALGRVVFANKAFQSHWKIDPDSSFADFTISDLVAALRRDIADDHIDQITTFINRPKIAQESQITCLAIDGAPSDLHLVRAPGQLNVLRHAMPAKPVTEKTRILTT